MTFTFDDKNTFRNVGIGTTNNKIIIMNVSKSTDNLSFHSTTNDTSVDIMSIKTILNKDNKNDLNISAFDGNTINPIIQINNTNQEINITSNLNIARNLNVAHNVVINGMANNDEYVLDIKNQDRKNCVVAIRSHLDTNIYDVYSYPSLLFSQLGDNIQTSMGLGPRSYNTGYENTNESTFYIEHKNKDGIRFAVDCDSVDGGKEMLFLDGNNLGVYIRQNTDILGNLNISHNLNIDNLTITHNSISTNVHPKEISFLDNTLTDIGLVKTNNAEINNTIINNGFINNTVIGNVTPNTGKFTTLTASSNLNVDGNINMNDVINMNGNQINFQTGTTNHYIKFSSSSMDGLELGAYGNGGPLFKVKTTDTTISNPVIFECENDKTTFFKPIHMNDVINMDNQQINFRTGFTTRYYIKYSNDDNSDGVEIGGYGGTETNSIFRVKSSGSTDNYVFKVFTQKAEFHKDLFMNGKQINFTGTNNHYIKFSSSSMDGLELGAYGNGGPLFKVKTTDTTISNPVIFECENDKTTFFKPIHMSARATIKMDGNNLLINNEPENNDDDRHIQIGKNSPIYIQDKPDGYTIIQRDTVEMMTFREGQAYSIILLENTLFTKNIEVDGQFINPSDDRFKTNEIPLTNCLQTILKLQPEFYTKTNLKNMTRNIGECPTYVDDEGNIQQDIDNWPKENYTVKTSSFLESGLIAQDTYNNAPELRHLVSIGDDALNNPENFTEDNKLIENVLDSNGIASYLGINYVGIIPYLIGAVKEMSAKINSLETENTELKSIINNLKNANSFEEFKQTL